MSTLQRFDRGGWVAYSGRRVFAVVVATGLVTGSVAVTVAAGLWIGGLVGLGPWAAQNALEIAPAPFVAPNYQIDATDAPGPEISSQAPTRNANDQAIGFVSADVAGAHCGEGETVIANFRGGYSCNIDMDQVREQQTGIRLVTAPPAGIVEQYPQP